MKSDTIVNGLLIWYDKHKRDLPWRKTLDPYKIWISEIILQQTRVDQGLPYYTKFIDKYPTVHDLASAPIDEVLRLWQGLGYYSRARNLHRCAKIVVENLDGNFPAERSSLLKLPGVGPYTSAAIASLAFGKREAVVDGNVIRVIARLYGIKEDISEQKTINGIRAIADELIPSKRPDLFNQAIMEFGALFCTPNSPTCDSCIFMDICDARSSSMVASIPFKSKKVKKRSRFFNYLIINIQEKYYLRKRGEKDIWQGLFEFYLLETQSDLPFDQLDLPIGLSRNSRFWKITEESKTYKHLLTHQTIFCKFYEIKFTQEIGLDMMNWEEYSLYSEEEIELLPKSILIDRYLGEKII